MKYFHSASSFQWKIFGDKIEPALMAIATINVNSLRPAPSDRQPEGAGWVLWTTTPCPCDENWTICKYPPSNFHFNGTITVYLSVNTEQYVYLKGIVIMEQNLINLLKHIRAIWMSLSKPDWSLHNFILFSLRVYWLTFE